MIVAFSAPSVGKDHSDQKDKKEHVNAYISRDLIMKAATKDGDLSKEDSVKLANYLKDVPNNPQTDSINKGDEAFAKEGKFMKSGNIFNSNNLKEYDSVQVAKNSTIAKIFRPFAKKAFELKEEGVSNKDVINGFIMKLWITF